MNEVMWCSCILNEVELKLLYALFVSSPLLLFLRDQTSSRLLEQVLLVLEAPRLQSLFEDHFQGQLQTLAAHPIANFPLQRLLDAITTPQLVRGKLDWVSFCYSCLLGLIL
jgi:hypothetical protein